VPYRRSCTFHQRNTPKDASGGAPCSQPIIGRWLASLYVIIDGFHLNGGGGYCSDTIFFKLIPWIMAAVYRVIAVRSTYAQFERPTADTNASAARY